jgi:glycosyltransferase involved in cell wall biosynthesis
MMKHDAYVAVDIGKRLGIPVILRPEGAGTTGDIAWQSWGRGGAAIARRAKQADAFVAISTGVHQELINAGYPPEKIVDLPNGVPIPSLSWLERAEFKTTPTAMFVGRLAEEKGLTCLIDAWPFVRERFPQAQLKLVGEGPMRERLTAHIQTLSLESHIQLLGAQQDPNGLLKKADLFVLPSREEGMSIALLEAMALAIPLVASDISGNRKLVTDGVEGKLVPPDNPERLAQAIVSQWSDFPSAVRQGFAARERVSQRFSIDAMARAHLVLFRDLTGG